MRVLLLQHVSSHSAPPLTVPVAPLVIKGLMKCHTSEFSDFQECLPVALEVELLLPWCLSCLTFCQRCCVSQHGNMDSSFKKEQNNLPLIN